MASDGVGARAAAQELGFSLQPRERWQPELAEILDQARSLNRSDERERKLRHWTGVARQELHGRAPAREIAELLRSAAEEVN